MSDRGRLAYVGGSAFQRAIPFLVLPVFVRFLEPAEYGQVAVLTAAFTLVSMTFGLGQEIVEYRYYFDDSPHGRRLLAASLRLHLLAPVAIAIVTGAFVVAVGVEYAGVPPAVLAGSILAGAMYVVAWRFPAVQLRCEGELVPYLWLAIGYAGLASLIKVVLIVGLGWGVVSWPIGDAVAAGVLFAFTSRAYLRHLRGQSLEGNRNALRRVLRTGGPAALSQGARWAAGFSDRVLVVGLVSASAGGSYLVATQLVSIAGLVILELSTYQQPIIARAPDPETAVRRALSRHVTAVSLVTILGAVGSVALVQLGFAGSYPDVARVAVLLSASLVFLGLTYLGGDICGVSLGATSYLAVASLASGGAAVVLCITLIPPLGLYGAVLAALLTQVLSATVIWIRILREIVDRRWTVRQLVVLPGACLASLGVLAAFTPR